MSRRRPFHSSALRSSRRGFLLAAFSFASALGGSVRARAAAPPPFRVIVNPHNSMGSATRDFLTDAFLKRRTEWPGGVTIRPVDQRPDTRVREAFSRNVLRRSVAAVRSYWQQRIFSGRGVPPPELDSDQDVVAYVLKHRGAVGYVSGGADYGKCRVLGVR